MLKLASHLALFGLATLIFSPPLHAAGYRFVQIDFPGAAWTATYGINARGHVVGRYFDADDVSHSFVLRNGEYTSIDVPGAAEMFAARGINARGDIVGNYVDSEGITLGYLLSDGEFQRIRYPGAEITLLSSINNAGDIVGLFFDEQTDTEAHFIRKGSRFHEVKFPEGLINPFVRAAMDNGRVLVGTVYLESDGGGHGFVRTGRDEFEIIDYPGQDVPCSHVRYMNEGGDMVGEFVEVESVEDCTHDAAASSHGYLYRDGEFTALDYPGASGTKTFAINSDRVIVGTYFEEDGTAHGFKAVPRE